MNITCHRHADLSDALWQQISRYRYKVFVQTLGWPLACAPGLECDEFDTPAATHVVASQSGRGIVGYARLLPTTGPYLLEQHFPQLLNGRTAPKAPEVWEISRYAAMDPGQGQGRLNSDVGKAVLLAAIQCARAGAAQRMICCTSVAIERVASRWGLHMHRLGVPERRATELVVATGIEFDNETLAVLAPRLHPITLDGLQAALPAESPACQRQGIRPFPPAGTRLHRTASRQSVSPRRQLSCLNV